MRYRFLIILLLTGFVSCKSAKHRNIVTKKDTKSEVRVSNKAQAVVSYAQGFNGVRYKYGGTTKKGMDCSGLVYVSFRKENVALPRISRDMAREGRHIKLNEVQQGDLLFFKTNKNRNVINHVGLVVSANKGSIKFIHATSSKGVLTSSLSESYWWDAFVEARRVL